MESKQTGNHQGPNDHDLDLKKLFNTQSSPDPSDEFVKIPLELFFPLVAEASGSGRVWLKDFAQDSISVSPDLYDVLQAYRHFHLEESLL